MAQELQINDSADMTAVMAKNEKNLTYKYVKNVFILLNYIRLNSYNLANMGKLSYNYIKLIIKMRRNKFIKNNPSVG